MNLSLLLRKHSILNVTNLHNFETTGIFKISSYGNFITTFACLILARNYNSPRTISVKVLTMPVAAERTVRAVKHF